MINLQSLRSAYGGEILSSDAELSVYSYDAALDRSRPDAAAVARSAEDVRRIVSWCAEHKVPFVARGAGTNLSGGCVALRGGVVISLAKLDRIISIDTGRREAVVEPGVVNLHLQKASEPLGLFYAPDPASFKVCSLGGNIGENAGGPRCLKYGTTTNHVLAVEAVMPDGSLASFSLEDDGPQIMSLLIGSEGTLGIVTRARLKLSPIPPVIITMLAAFASLDAAMSAVAAVIAAGVVPRVLEAMDRMTVDSIEAFLPCGLPKAEAVLMIEVEGSAETAAREAEKIKALCSANGVLELRTAADQKERDTLWEGRRSAYAALARLAPNVLVEDGVVPRDKLPEASRRIQEIARRFKIKPALLFHAGDGNLHPNIIFDERDADETARVKEGGFEILKLCVELGGSISGEHGIGIDKRRAMAWLFTPETLALFRRIKKAFDPDELANPDKLFPLQGETPPEGIMRPPGPEPSSSQLALIERVRELARLKTPFSVVGSESKTPRALREKHTVVSTKALDRIVFLDKANFIVTVEAGMPLSALNESLANEGFHAQIPVVPGTIGGLLAANPWPELRDSLLWMKLLLPDGTVVEAGSKVVKSVAGYDVPRLLMGSWGMFGIILESSFKVYATHQEFPLSLPAPKRPKPNPWLLKLKTAFDPESLLNGWVLSGDSDA